MALLQAYEKTLVPYERVKVTWAEKVCELKEGKEPKWLDEDQEQTLIRDQDRLRTICKITSEMSKSQQKWNESVWERGKNGVDIYPPLPGFGDQNVPSVLSNLKVTEEAFLINTGRGLPGSHGTIFSEWIPTFLRTAKLSAEVDTVAGKVVNVLCGVRDDIEIKLWLDPSIAYTPRKISYDKRSSNPKSTAVYREYEVKRFQEIDGAFIPAEATWMQKLPPRPVLSPFAVQKTVDGKNVWEHSPAKDKDGNVMMSPGCTYQWEARLKKIELNPKFTDDDFKFSRPIPNGTRVSVQDEPPLAHITYEWRDGAVMKMVESTVKGKFDPATDSKAVIAKCLNLAKDNNEHVLVMYGADAWRQCDALEEAFQSAPETLRQLIDEFEVAYVDVTNPTNRTLAAEYGLVLDKPETLCWSVLDQNGKVLCNQDLAAFEQSGRYDAKNLTAFLNQWMAKREDAEASLKAALERAAKEQKKVFYIRSGKFCGPCHRFINFLNAHQEIFAQDYIIVALNMDRVMHDEEVAARVGYPSGSGAGVPWYAILSPAGEKLISSMGPKGNIGFPNEQPDIDHFMKMIRQTSSRISSEQLKDIEASLIAEGKKF